MNETEVVALATVMNAQIFLCTLCKQGKCGEQKNTDKMIFCDCCKDNHG